MAKNQIRRKLKKLIENINKNFSEDQGFPKDFVKAHVNEQGDFCLHIGWRDIQLEANGEFIGCGSDVDLMKKWTDRL